jgi:hypothetical protein
MAARGVPAPSLPMREGSIDAPQQHAMGRRRRVRIDRESAIAEADVKPVLALAAAAAAGAVIGGLVLTRVSRLFFIAAAGFTVAELWHREGNIDVTTLARGRRTRPRREQREAHEVDEVNDVDAE